MLVDDVGFNSLALPGAFVDEESLNLLVDSTDLDTSCFSTEVLGLVFVAVDTAVFVDSETEESTAAEEEAMEVEEGSRLVVVSSFLSKSLAFCLCASLRFAAMKERAK